MLSAGQRTAIERDINKGSILVHGSKQRCIEAIRPFGQSTLALDADHSKVTQRPQIYATENINVATFCATTWSRDGWSGWYSYAVEPAPGYARPQIIYEFFAGPYVLREACFTVGSLYVVNRDRFESSQGIPGEFISIDEVPVEEEYSVDFDDIQQYVYRSIHMSYNQERALRDSRKALPLNVDRLLALNPANDPRNTMLMDQADNWYEHHQLLS
jgi:hypothetical protein